MPPSWRHGLLHFSKPPGICPANDDGEGKLSWIMVIFWRCVLWCSRAPPSHAYTFSPSTFACPGEDDDCTCLQMRASQWEKPQPSRERRIQYIEHYSFAGLIARGLASRHLTISRCPPALLLEKKYLPHTLKPWFSLLVPCNNPEKVSPRTISTAASTMWVGGWMEEEWCPGSDDVMMEKLTFVTSILLLLFMIPNLAGFYSCSMKSNKHLVISLNRWWWW